MSRLLLAASCLTVPLLATACDPEPSDAQAFLAGNGLDDATGSLWYAPGAEDELAISTKDPALASWSYATTGSLGLAGAPPPADGNRQRLRLRAGDVGDGELVIDDELGRQVAMVTTHVRNPDTIDVLGSTAGRLATVGATVHVLEGETVTLGVAYAAAGHRLAGGNLLTATAPGGIRATAQRGTSDALAIGSAAEPYAATLRAGPDATRTLEVVPVMARDAELTLTTDEATIASRTATLTFVLRDRSGLPVQSSWGRWTRDGVAIRPRLSYVHDTAAPPSVITVTLGAPGAEVTASVTIHTAEDL